MALLAWGIGLALVFIVAGVLLSFTDVWLLLGIGAGLFWLGWFLLLLGVALLIALIVRAALFEKKEPRRRRMT